MSLQLTGALKAHELESKSTLQRKGANPAWGGTNPLILLVAGTGFEPVTFGL